MRTRLAIVLCYAMATTASADPTRFQSGYSAFGVEIGAAFAAVRYAPTHERFDHDALRLFWGVRAEFHLCGTRWWIGTSLRYSTETSVTLAATMRRDFDHLRAGFELGTFTCTECRAAEDPRLSIRASLEAFGGSVFVESRVTAFDAFQQARPLGTRTEVLVGAAATDWRAAAALAAIEFIVVAYQLAQPDPPAD